MIKTDLSSFRWSLIIVTALAFQTPPWGSLCGRCEYAGCRAKVPYFLLRPSRAVKSEFAAKRRFRFASEPRLLCDFSPSLNFLARHLWENRGAIISLQTGAADKREGSGTWQVRWRLPLAASARDCSAFRTASGSAEFGNCLEKILIAWRSPRAGRARFLRSRGTS